MSRNNLHRSPSKRISKSCLETLEGRRLLSFAAAANYPVGTNPQDIVTADFNGDGKLDLATVNKGSSNVNVLPGSVSVMLGDGTGGFGAATPFATGRMPNCLAVADFNGDAKLDLVAGCDDPYILLGNGNGTFQAGVRVGPGFYTILDVAVGDFNGDSKMDLVVNELDDMTGIGGSVRVLRGNGLGGFLEPLGVGVYPSYGLTVADVNGDNNLDAVTTMYTMLGNGDGTLREAVQNFGFSFNPDQLPRASTIAEMTGDGVPDLVIASDTVEVVGAGVISHPAVDFFYTAVATADFDGDGKLDAIATYSNADVWLGNGAGEMTSFGAFAVGSAPAGVAVGDFNGDGRPDLAAANGGSNNVSVLLNDGSWGQPPPPAPPGISVSDAPAVTEGNAGTRNATFSLNLSKPTAVDVTVNYSTANVAGSAVAGSDYEAKTGTVTIPAGQTSASFTVAVIGDRTPEQTEIFAVNLSAPTNATIVDSQGIGMILDDEPRISINKASKIEGNSKTTTMIFTVSLSAAYDQAVTVNYATANGTARAGSDYSSKSGSVTFAPGETIKTITVVVQGDKQRESAETFFVDLFGASSNSLISTARGTGTILDDDSLWRSLMRSFCGRW